MCENCECCHVPDHGACDTFERGMNGRCVYCDHDEGCHPGKGAAFNLPLSTGRRASASVSKEGDTVKENPDYLDREECARMYDIDPSIVGSPEHSTVTHVARRTAEDCHWFLVAACARLDVREEVEARMEALLAAGQPWNARNK